MTVEELISRWAAQQASSLISGNVSTRDGKLYSWALEIAAHLPDKHTALILPHGTSTASTNRHIAFASQAIHNTINVRAMFHVPVLNLKAPENIAYFLGEIEAHRKQLLNTRCRYATRVLACEHYCEAVQELHAYLQAVEYAEEVKVPDTPVLDIIEEAGDMKFLGKLGLEGDSCRIHALDEQ